MNKFSVELTKLQNDLAKLYNLVEQLRFPVFVENFGLQEKTIFIHLACCGNKSMKELSSFLSVKPNIMTGIISRLEEKGLVSRFHGEDLRVVIVSVDPEWQRLYKIHERELENYWLIMTEAIGKKDFDLLIKLLSKAKEKLEKKLSSIKRIV